MILSPRPSPQIISVDEADVEMIESTDSGTVYSLPKRLVITWSPVTVVTAETGSSEAVVVWDEFCVVSSSEPEQAAKDKASRNAQVSDNSFFIDDTSFLFK